MDNKLMKLPPRIDMFTVSDFTFKPETAIAAVKKALDCAGEITAVITQSDLDTASLIISDIKKISAELEKHRVLMKAPALEYGKEVDQYFKSIASTLPEELKRLGGYVEKYLVRQRQIKEAKAEEERLLMQKQLDAEKKKAAENDQPIPDAIVPEVVVKHEKLSSQNAAGISTRRYRRWKVVDISLVPVQYLQVNEVLMNKKRAELDFEDKSPIPGIEYYFEEKV